MKKLLPTFLSIAVICGLGIGLLGAVGCGKSNNTTEKKTEETKKTEEKKKTE